MIFNKKTSKRASLAAITAIFVLALGTFSFGQTSFGDIWTTAVTQNFFQRLMSTAATSGDETKAATEDKKSEQDKQSAPSAAFTPGNIVVCRVGTGAAALGNDATAVFVDEYTPAGGLVQAVPLPTAVSVQIRY